VASEAADDVVLALNEAAANAILYRSGGAPPARETGASAGYWGRRLVIEASFEVRPLGDW
jgi:anti-sigma regulatory factor (Ser/Thr protein kinase)